MDNNLRNEQNSEWCQPRVRHHFASCRLKSLGCLTHSLTHSLRSLRQSVVSVTHSVSQFVTQSSQSLAEYDSPTNTTLNNEDSSLTTYLVTQSLTHGAPPTKAPSLSHVAKAKARTNRALSRPAHPKTLHAVVRSTLGSSHTHCPLLALVASQHGERASTTERKKK